MIHNLQRSHGIVIQYYKDFIFHKKIVISLSDLLVCIFIHLILLLPQFLSSNYKKYFYL